MAFAGALEDLAIPDILQMLHVSRRTGRLVVRGPVGREAELRLRDGAIVGARHPSKDVTVGGILLDLGLVGITELDAALERQASSTPEERAPLVSTLVAMGALEQADGHRALRKLIEETVVEVVAWTEGSFEFDVDVVRDTGEFQHLPGAIGEGVGLDTQGALMDALRILDERNRAAAEEARRAAAPSSPPPTAAAVVAGAERRPEPDRPAPPGAAAAPSQGPHTEPVSVAPALPARARVKAGTDDDERLLAVIDGRAAPAQRGRDKAFLFCSDGFLENALRAAGAGRGLDVLASEHAPDHLGRLEALVADDVPAALVVDLAGVEGHRHLERGATRLMEQAAARFPEVPLVALTRSDPESVTRAFAQGATAVLPRPRRGGMPEAFVAAMSALVETLVAALRGHFDRRAALGRRPLDCRRQMAALKQRVQEIRHDHGSSEISLIVLRYVADIFERCVIFLVRRDDLLGLGAFGLDGANETVSPAVLRLKVPLDEGTLLHDVVADGKLVHGTADDPTLRAHLYPRIGSPAKPDIVLVPLRAEQRTAAVIYADFGARQAAPVETDALEILAHQAGLALELALTRTRVGKPAGV